jgi:hypothetical protein
LKPRNFWGTAFLAALGFAFAVAFLMPYGLLAAETSADRLRIWLLTLWTAGVMAICFGSAGLISALAPLGFREVAEVGSVSAAVEARREEHRKAGGTPFYNFAGWTLITGVCLILLYFAAWLVTS